MRSSHPPRFPEFDNPVVRRIAVTATAGGFTYAITNLTGQPQSTVLTLSILIGGVTLLAQFLSSFEARQRRVEDKLASFERHQADALRGVKEILGDEIARMNQATRTYDVIGRASISALSADRVASIAAGLAGMAPSLAFKVAQVEIDSALRFAEELSKGREVTYEGEDRDWLQALTRNVRTTMDATSRASSTAGGGFEDEGFWDSEIGMRYLEWQREAIERGITVRRIFVLDDISIIAGSEFQNLLREQADVGITVRILDASKMSSGRRLLIPDIIIFDREISYELARGSKFGSDAVPYFINTRLILEPEAVGKRIRSFEDLWGISEALPTGSE
jgi:hypothetical protein